MIELIKWRDYKNICKIKNNAGKGDWRIENGESCIKHSTKTKLNTIISINSARLKKKRKGDEKWVRIQIKDFTELTRIEWSFPVKFNRCVIYYTNKKTKCL